MNHKLKKYISNKLANKEWSPHARPKKSNYDFLITIPCYDEIDYIFNTLDSINKQDRELLDRTLVSIIINNSN